MKIAIQGHPTRGHEVIQILESLGGKKLYYLNAPDKCLLFYIDDKEYISCIHHESPLVKECFKIYTLEEFEKEFPFKVGDMVTVITDTPYKIVALEYYFGRLCYRLDNGLNYDSEALKPYKEMKEERNITLTLDKAKEWYKKGGELKEVALQAFSEKELTKIKLPKTWKEFCDNYPVQEEYWLGSCDQILRNDSEEERTFRNWIPSKKSAEAHLALIQLEQLRDCWRQGWEPTPHQTVFAIKFAINGLSVYEYCSREFLSFKDRKTATEFLKCFKDLIEKAGDLI